MRFDPSFVFGSAFLILLSNGIGCGGKVYAPGDDAAGAAGTGGTSVGGSGGSGGSGGTTVGGSGGGPAGSGGYPAGSGGGPAGSGGYPAGSGGGPAGSGGYPAGSGGGPAGSGGYPGGSGGGPGGSGGYAGGSCWDYLPAYTVCRECIDTNCCGEVINCFNDPQGFCPQAVSCFESCPMGDPMACAQMCDQGMYNVPFNDVISCGTNFCPAECMNPVQPDCPLQTGDPQCDNCMNSICGYECNACINNNQCMDLLMCVQECYDDACYQQCFMQYPAGVDPLMAFLGQDGCLAVNCSGACGF